MIEFKLSKEELAGEIYRAINEIYPEISLESDSIFGMLRVSEDGDRFIFSAKEFAGSNNLAGEEFLNKLYHCLGIEFEKNLHDKFLFEMSRDNINIIFNTIGPKINE